MPNSSRNKKPHEGTQNVRRAHRLQRLSAKGKTVGFGIFLVCSIFVVALIGSCVYNLFLLSPFSSQQKVPSPYDWSNLKTDESGRLSYVQNGQTISRTGIDVSSHQQQINWSSVAQDGISFAYIRLGYRGSSEGTLHVDDFFAQNLSGAKNAGIDVGVYFFSQAITEEEAREEARFVLKQLDGASLDYPIAFDMEPSPEGSGRADALTREEATAIANAFCDEIQKSGYRAIIYGNSYDLSKYDLSALTGRIWLAQYDGKPDGSISFVMWQYTPKGTVAGISGSVDLNLDLSDVPKSAPRS